MTHSTFNQLGYEAQLITVFDEGAFLAWRWEGTDRINLYHLGGFFVELYYDTHDTHAGRIACVGSFRNTVPLEAYVAWMQLPKLLQA